MKQFILKMNQILMLSLFFSKESLKSENTMGNMRLQAKIKKELVSMGK